MRYEQVQLYDEHGAQLQAPIPETEEDQVPADKRLAACTPLTRYIIERNYGGDFDEALYHAIRALQLYRHPPGWAIEVVGDRRVTL